MTVGVPEINNSSWRIKYVEKKEEEPEPKMTAPIKAGAPKGGGTGFVANSGLSTKQPKDLGITDTEPDGEGGRIKLPAVDAAQNLKERLQRVRVGQPVGGLPKKQKPKKVKERKEVKDVVSMTDEEHEKHINSGKWHEEQKKLKKLKEQFRKQRRARNEAKPSKEQKEESSKFQNQKPIEERLDSDDKEALSDLHGKKGTGRAKPQPKKEELSKPTTDKIELADLNVDISDYQNQDNKSLHRRLVEAGYENQSTDKKAYKNRKLADMLKRGETHVKIKRPPQETGTKHYWNAPEDKDSLASDSEMEEKRQVERLGGKTQTEHKDIETKHKVPPAKRTGESQSDKDNERGGDASEQEVKEEKEGTEDDKEATEYDTATDDLKESDKEEAKLNVSGKHKKTRIRRQRKLGEPPEDVKPETVGDDRKEQKTYRGDTLQSDTKGGKYTSGEGSEKEFQDRDGEGQEQDKEKKELARKRKLEAQERKDEGKPTKEMEKLQTKLHNSRVRAYVTTLTANEAGRFKKLSPEKQKIKLDAHDKKKNKSVESWNKLSSKIQGMNSNVKQQNIGNKLGKLTNTVGSMNSSISNLSNRTQDEKHSADVRQNIKDRSTV